MALTLFNNLVPAYLTPFGWTYSAFSSNPVLPLTFNTLTSTTGTPSTPEVPEGYVTLTDAEDASKYTIKSGYDKLYDAFVKGWGSYGKTPFDPKYLEHLRKNWHLSWDYKVGRHGKIYYIKRKSSPDKSKILVPLEFLEKKEVTPVLNVPALTSDVSLPSIDLTDAFRKYRMSHPLDAVSTPPADLTVVVDPYGGWTREKAEAAGYGPWDNPNGLFNGYNYWDLPTESLVAVTTPKPASLTTTPKITLLNPFKYPALVSLPQSLTYSNVPVYNPNPSIGRNGIRWNFFLNN